MAAASELSGRRGSPGIEENAAPFVRVVDHGSTLLGESFETVWFAESERRRLGGRSEPVVGEIVETLGLRDRLFLATKVWTSGQRSGVAQMNESFRRFRVDRLDLMQVHNLVDVDTHLATSR